jgi:hypothetical protein
MSTDLNETLAGMRREYDAWYEDETEERYEASRSFEFVRQHADALLSAVQNVLAIEPARSDGNALSRASGYNTALADVRKALTDALEGGEAS